MSIAQVQGQFKHFPIFGISFLHVSPKFASNCCDQVSVSEAKALVCLKMRCPFSSIINTFLIPKGHVILRHAQMFTWFPSCFEILGCQSKGQGTKCLGGSSSRWALANKVLWSTTARNPLPWSWFRTFLGKTPSSDVFVVLNFTTFSSEKNCFI